MEEIESGEPISDDYRVINERACPSVVEGCIGSSKNFQSMSILHTSMGTNVFLTRTKTSPSVVTVIKRYKKALMTLRNHAHVLTEISVHQSLFHDHVIPIYGAWSDRTHVYVVIEHAPHGDLYTQIFLATLHKPLETTNAYKMPTYCIPPDIVCASIIRPLLTVLVHVHSKGVIHRDIKPENLLMDASWTLKLADFGLAVDTLKKRPITKMVGTCDYMSPEVIRSNYKGPYTHKVDVWAVGVVAYEVLFGVAPFLADSDYGKLQRIINDEVFFPSFVSAEIADFISQCLVKDCASRPSASGLLDHPWVAHCPATTDYIHYYNDLNPSDEVV